MIEQQFALLAQYRPDFAKCQESTMYVLAKKLLNNETVRDYGKVDFHSNERLKDIFNNVDVKDKRVLTVLASGDHVFYAYDNGAKSVECFDINKLVIWSNSTIENNILTRSLRVKPQAFLLTKYIICYLSSNGRALD